MGTNADEGRLFTRFLHLLPTTEPMIDALLADSDVEVRDRITQAYPGYPSSSACIRLGGDFAFGTAAWQITDAHGRHAPTYVYRYDYAPRTFHWSGIGATHGTELFAVFDVPDPVRIAAHRRGGPALGTPGEQRRAGTVARLQQNRAAGRRLARVHRGQPSRHGVRSALAPGVRPRCRSAPRVGGLLARRQLTPS